MKSLRPFFALFLFCCLPPVSASELPEPVARALARAGVPAASVALAVQDVSEPRSHARPWLAHNAERAMNPASVMKLVTTYAALDILGPAHVWRTEILADGEVRDGVLRGNLYLRGAGDPKLGVERLWLLLRELRARGIAAIAGDLVVDRRRFALPPEDPARFDGEPLRAYNVGADPLLINFRTLRLIFTPDAAQGRLHLAVLPQPANLDVVNLARLGRGPCNGWRDALRFDTTQHGEQTRLMITGTYSESCGERSLNLAPLDAERYAAGVIADLWRSQGGRLEGAIRPGSVPDLARKLFTYDSPPLAEAVRDINKFSNNVMARQLFLSLAPEGGDDAAAGRTVEAWLAGRDMDMPELVMDNGSGLSRNARVSAASLLRLLAAARHGPHMPDFVASLPRVAVDGTMRRRLNGHAVAGSAYIKTGTLEGVRSLAGYVVDGRGRWQAVAMLINHPQAGAAQEAMDAALEWVHRGGR